LDFAALTSQLDITHFGMIFQLVILEGLLSFDNALALAALVTGRLTHPLDRKSALLWGIWGAYVIRVGIVFVGVWLMKHEWIKLVAGGYLIWMAVNELFLKKSEKSDETEEHTIDADGNRVKVDAAGRRAPWHVLWKTIVAVEIMDLMFSVDSIAVALAVSDETWVLISGAVLGILMMRIAASYFIKMIDRFPVLVPTAFVLVGIAGLKVVLEVEKLKIGETVYPLAGLHISDYVFLPTMLGILVGAVVLNILFPKWFHKADS
jgi:YkoY family integral membrane protein